MKTYKIHLIRHGMTDANILGTYIGNRTDMPLSPEGVRELKNLKQNLEYVGDDAIKEIRITGGGASSPLWAGIKSDVTGKVLKTLTESETACLGSALAAAVGVGEFDSLKSAVDQVVKTTKVYEPTGLDYTDAYDNYCKLDKLLN